MPPINLGVGEPQHPIPDFVSQILVDNVADFRRYPAIKGSDSFRSAVGQWLDRRYDLNGFIDPATGILPLNGSREGLFFALFEACKRKPVSHPLVFSPNPFYQTYAAAAQGAGCTFLAAPEVQSGPDKGLPDFAAIDPEQLKNTVAVYVAAPANPQGTFASMAYWQALIELARSHDFMVFADECYSEIYRDKPPVGVLEAAKQSGSLQNVLTFNSLSKRSNLAGLRAGFMAGDTKFLKDLAQFRNMAAPQVPLPIQAVAAAAYGDEAHVENNRALYNVKYDVAQNILGDVLPYETPQGGFFLWLDCTRFGRGEDLAKTLWVDFGLRTIPGSYLSADEIDVDGRVTNKSEHFIRLALVHDLAATETALKRLKHCLIQMDADSISKPSFSEKQTGKFHA